jgi:Carboxypeptidase regulatory-like domain/TonB dependent receptor
MVGTKPCFSRNPQAGPRRVAAHRAARIILMLVCVPVSSPAQTLALLQGRVFDASRALITGASVSVRDDSTGFGLSVSTDAEGRYSIVALPVGTYLVEAAATGFRSEIIQGLDVEVGRTLVRDFYLDVGDRTESVIVRAEHPLLDRTTSTLGHVVPARTIQEIPLNGHHFVDLGLLVPGSVAPSQAGFSSTPIRGTGALAFNSAGNREEAVAYLVNGVTTNNLTYGSIGFPPPVASIREFKVDNSTFSAEFGHVSGAIVNLVTRSGTDEFGGDVYEFLRNDALDARNFFEFTSTEPHRFERYEFGGSLGGPIIRGRSHFFATYEGLRQRQGLDVNSLVLSDDQRARVTSPVIQRLIELVPRANFFDADGTPRFVGAAAATVDSDTWTVDFRQNVTSRARVGLFFGWYPTRGIEPSSQGTSIPGFGQTRNITRSILTANHTHVFGSGLLNEARYGRSGQDGRSYPAASLNPADYGIGNGVTRPIGLPQMIVAGGLNFGGPAILPQGRQDALHVINDTVTRVTGRHSMRAGAEYRRFLNHNFAEGTGQFNFPSVASFIAGSANAFSITLGERRSHITQDALAAFVQDQITLRRNLTFDVGLRYEWHVTPTERDNQFVVFDAATASLLRVGSHVGEIYQQNHANFEPRVGVAWTPSSGGRTVVRAAFGSAVDQPSTTVVRDTAGNPPFAIPLTAAGAISVSDAIRTTRPIGLAPVTVDPRFRNASLRSWNVNLQRQLAAELAVMVGYFGSRGKNLRIARNINQPVAGVQPFPATSLASPILPGTPLGNITQIESTGFSSYRALWASATKRLSRGLSFDASYTWSKSLDTNSLNSSGFAVQDSYNIPNEYGLSDFDARHRFVVSATYELPFSGHALTRGWQLATIIQVQSGNPFNIVTSNSTLNGLPNTVRPDRTGPISIFGSVNQWFDPSPFVAVPRFGTLGRNEVIGPPFRSTDFSISKSVTVARRYQLRLRADIFNLFNQTNLGPPGNVVGSPMFGKISRTRLPTGEAGSSRQTQLAVRLSF